MTAKKMISDLHDKYYKNKKSKKQKQEAKVVKVIKDKKAIKAKTSSEIKPSEAQGATIAEPTKTDDQAKQAQPESCESLMQKAKQRGIKYFRILSKADLVKVLADSISPQEITVITEAAQARWKAGWGSKKKAEVVV